MISKALFAALLGALVAASPAQSGVNSGGTTVLGIDTGAPRVTVYADQMQASSAFGKIMACQAAVLKLNPLGGTCDASGILAPVPFVDIIQHTGLTVPPTPMTTGGMTVILPDNVRLDCDMNDTVGQEHSYCLWLRQGGTVKSKSGPFGGQWTTFIGAAKGVPTNMVALVATENSVNTNNYMGFSGFGIMNDDVSNVNGVVTVHNYSSGHFLNLVGMADHFFFNDMLVQNGNSAQSALMDGCCGGISARSTFSGSLGGGYPPLFQFGGEALLLGSGMNGFIFESPVISSPANGYHALHGFANSAATIFGMYHEGNGGGPGGGVYPQSVILLDQGSRIHFIGGTVRGGCDAVHNAICDGNFEPIENHSVYTVTDGTMLTDGFVTGFDDRAFPGIRHNWPVEGGDSTIHNYGVVPRYVGGVVSHVDGTTSSPYDVPPTGACKTLYGSRGVANNGVGFHCDPSTQMWANN